MELIIYKALAMLLILSVTWLTGAKPIFNRSRHVSSIHSLGESFASGVFLGAGLFHMLPDATKGLNQLYPHVSFPLANIICAAGFVFLLFMEKVLFRFVQVKKENKANLFPIILTLVLSVHSLIEGTALGINHSIAGLMIIFIAIIAHKGSESYALAINLVKSHLTRNRIILIFCVFSLMTPIGIALGSLIDAMIKSNLGILLEAIFNAIAAGSFLYIATLHQFPEHHHDHSSNHFFQFLALVAGLGIMALVAIWV